MNNLTFSYQYKPPQKKKNKKGGLILLLILGLVILGYLIFIIPVKSDLISPLGAIQVNITQDNSLKGVMEKTLSETTGTYGVAVKNLKTKESYYSNEHRVFDSGSLYKLWVMATVYQQIQNGQLTENQVLSEDVVALNQKFNIDPDLAEMSEGTVTLTIHDALNQMIAISHNYAALLLTEKIRLSSVATFLKENGFTQSTVGVNEGSPTTTPYEMALFLEKLYKGELASQQYTDEMISLLKNQQLNDGLPKYLPDQSKVAHKTGDIGWFKHDAGIVYTDFGDYVVVVMSESDSPSGAQEKIALISKAVFDYFE